MLQAMMKYGQNLKGVGRSFVVGYVVLISIKTF